MKIWVIFIEMVIVVVDANEIKGPGASLSELYCLMACEGEEPYSKH